MIPHASHLEGVAECHLASKSYSISLNTQYSSYGRMYIRMRTEILDVTTNLSLHMHTHIRTYVHYTHSTLPNKDSLLHLSKMRWHTLGVINLLLRPSGITTPPPLGTYADPANDVLDMPVDPNEPTYCLCHQVS